MEKYTAVMYVLKDRHNVYAVSTAKLCFSLKLSVYSPHTHVLYLVLDSGIDIVLRLLLLSHN